MKFKKISNFFDEVDIQFPEKVFNGLSFLHFPMFLVLVLSQSHSKQSDEHENVVHNID